MRGLVRLATLAYQGNPYAIAFLVGTAIVIGGVFMVKAMREKALHDEEPFT